MKDLTQKQRLFVMAYLETADRVQAYRRSYNCAAMSARTIRRKAQEVAALLHVAAKIRELQDAAMARNSVSVDQIIGHYKQIVDANICDFLVVENGNVRIKDLDGLSPAQRMCIKRLRQGPYGVEIELFDSQKALDSIARHLGMFTERHRHEMAGGFNLIVHFDKEQPPMSPDEIIRMQALDN